MIFGCITPEQTELIRARQKVKLDSMLVGLAQKARIEPDALNSTSIEFVGAITEFVDRVRDMSRGADISIFRHDNATVAVRYVRYPDTSTSLEPIHRVQLFSMDARPSTIPSEVLISYLTREANATPLDIKDLDLGDLARIANFVEELKKKSDGLYVKLYKEGGKITMKYTMFTSSSGDAKVVTGKAHPLEKDPAKLIRI